jgi:hypothetical protein
MSPFNLHLVAERSVTLFHLIVFKCARQLIWQMRIQRATKAHIHHLAASTDAQKWFPIFGDGSQQTELQLVS